MGDRIARGGFDRAGEEVNDEPKEVEDLSEPRLTLNDLMTAYYAAATSVREGEAAEVEIEHRYEDEDAETAETLTMSGRREVRPFMATHVPPEDEDCGPS